MFSSYKTILVEKNSNSYLEVTLNRPQVHNAMNLEMILELKSLFTELKSLVEQQKVSERFVLLKANGLSFSAGADLNWMKQARNFSFAENVEDSKHLGHMLQIINRFPLPIVAQVQGACLGGAMGLVSVCDYVVAHSQAMFGFPEVRLGILPALISPYVWSKIGMGHARSLFLTGIRINAQRALEIGLVHQVATDFDDLNIKTQDVINSLLKCAPKALQEVKKLIAFLAHDYKDRDNLLEDNPLLVQTSQMIAQLRGSAEGQEGMDSVLSRKTPSWVIDNKTGQ